MEITGKLIQKLAPLTGQSAKGVWKKQEIIIETEGQYPKKVCLMVWNDKVDLDNVAIGQTIKAFVEPESREYNNKWYTDIKMWKIETSSVGTPKSTISNNDIPMPEPPPESDGDYQSMDEDGLPF